MPIGVQSFRGHRLREARLARGLFKKSLGDMVGISGVAISRYEDGQDKPLPDKLAALAQHLAFPEQFFLQPAWDEVVEPIFWRSRANETKIAREMTEQRMRWLCEIFGYLDEEVNFPDFNLPEIDVPADFRLITPEVIERAAEGVRAAWRLGRAPIPNVILSLENAGIPVVNLEIGSDKQDGFCFKSKRLSRVFVGINTYHVSACRARYDAAHELGHAILHGNVTAQQERDKVAHKMLEQQAHRFAAAFLFPRESFFSEVGSPSLDYFCSLKRKWGMSIAAMVYRSYDLGLADEVEKSLLFQNMGRRRWRGVLREPFDSEADMPIERPRMLRRGMEVIANDSPSGRASMLAALPHPRPEIEQISGLERGFFDTASIYQMDVTKRSDGNLKMLDAESGTVVEFPGRRRA